MLPQIPDSGQLYVVRRVACFKKGPIHNCAVLVVDLNDETKHEEGLMR